MPKQWPGYETRRNRTANSFQNEHTQRHTGSTMNSWLYHYRRQGAAATVPKLATTAALGERDALVRAARGEPDMAPLAAEAAPSAPAATDFVCPHCGKGLRSEQGLRTHVRSVHELQRCGDDWQPNR